MVSALAVLIGVLLAQQQNWPYAALSGLLALCTLWAASLELH